MARSLHDNCIFHNKYHIREYNAMEIRILVGHWIMFQVSIQKDHKDKEKWRRRRPNLRMHFFLVKSARAPPWWLSGTPPCLASVALPKALLVLGWPAPPCKLQEASTAAGTLWWLVKLSVAGSQPQLVLQPFLGWEEGLLGNCGHKVSGGWLWCFLNVLQCG